MHILYNLQLLDVIFSAFFLFCFRNFHWGMPKLKNSYLFCKQPAKSIKVIFISLNSTYIILSLPFLLDSFWVPSLCYVAHLCLYAVYFNHWASLVAQLVKNTPTMWETWLWSLGWEDLLGRESYTTVFWPGEFRGLYSPWGH